MTFFGNVVAGGTMAKTKKKHKLQMPKESLCWQCKNAVPSPWTGAGCEWSREYKPVPGWKAEMRERTNLKGSYFVFKCPKFEKEKK